MRILMLAQFYPPTIGGEERFVADLSADLAERGHTVSVATLWHKGNKQFEVNRGVRIHRIKGSMQRIGVLFSENDRQYAPPFPDPEAAWALQKVVKEEQPDVIHAHNWIVHSYTPLKALNKARLVVTLNDYSLVCVQKRLMRDGIRCSGPELMKCISCANKFYGPAKGAPTVLANSFWENAERRVVDMFLPVSQAVVDGTELVKHASPYRIIPNIIPDNVEVADDDEPLLEKLPKGDFLLFVGDVRLDKGVGTLLQAYKELNTEMPLVLIGRPLAGLEKNLPRNVHLMGGWPHKAVMAAWRRSTIAFVPSTWSEPFGIVALEAMMMGRPVIASRIGGLTDIVVDGETGLLVPAGDSHALSQAMQDLIDDPEKRERMGAMGKKRVVEFQAKSVVPRYEQLYREVLIN